MEGRESPQPRPRRRTTAARQPGGDREEGLRPQPAPKPRGQNRKPARRKRNAPWLWSPVPALLATRPLRRQQPEGRPLLSPSTAPAAAPGPRVATAHCRPPFACPPARPPGTRPAPPLAAAHRAESDPGGWLRSHLEQATKPGPASASNRLGGSGDERRAR